MDRTEEAAAWQKKLKEYLDGSGDHFYDLRCFRQVDSTNDFVRRAAEAGAPEGLVAVAEEQTAGRGRRGRAWSSPPGGAVYFSVLLRPELPPERAATVTAVMGLSAAEAVREAAGLSVRIKWPNDLVAGGKKLCGTLTEAGAENGRIRYLVVGTGINVNNTVFPEELRDRATSVALALRGEGAAPLPEGTICRGTLMAAVLSGFLRNYRIFLEDGGLLRLRARYEALLTGLHGPVRIEDPRGPYEAVAEGVDELGHLQVSLPGGELRSIDSGEVSVRGLKGYV